MKQFSKIFQCNILYETLIQYVTMYVTYYKKCNVKMPYNSNHNTLRQGFQNVRLIATNHCKLPSIRAENTAILGGIEALLAFSKNI